MVATSRAQVAVATRCALGEGPTWDAVHQRLLWLDIDGQQLHEWSEHRHRVLSLAQRTTAVVPSSDGGLVGVVGTSVVVLDGAGRVTDTIANLPPDGDGTANDARCDPHGRLWVGTVDRSGARRAGLFVVSADGVVRQARDGCGLSNGLDWSPDGATCYFADTFAHRVHRLHLGSDGLPVSSSVLFETDLLPDGISVDGDGGVWVAFWDGGAVHRYTPDGRLDHVVEVANGGFVTSCAFGGADLRTMFVTTATGDGDDALGDDHAGALFAVDVGVAGRGYTAFG
jgi:sugar lactone lactonase YvrE